MPKISPQCPCSLAEQLLPQPSPQQKRQIKSHPQLPPAQGKGAVQPHEKQLQTDQELAQSGKPPVQGLEHIRRRPQQHAP